MPTTTYGAVLRLPGVARLFVVSFVARIPAAMIGVVLTLHVVTGLGRGYAEAGAVVGAATGGMALGAPWRGRLVDRFGLRRAIAPSVVVESAVWFTAPHLSYEALIAAVFLGGLFLVPVFSVSRQSLSVLVPIQHQRPAFALDSVAVELTFMLSPVVGVLLATQASTQTALTVVGSLTVLAGLLLMWADPPTRSGVSLPVVDDRAPSRLLTPALVVVLLAGVAAAFVLVGTDVSLVATLNDAGRPQDVGWMIALWAGGSVIGGLVHGTARRSPSPLVLVAVLALATAPAAFAHGQVWLAVAVVVAGLPCAPALSSINATLVRLVPEGRRGEVMGWSGTMSTVGNALGAPLCGAVIDRAASGAGFLTAAVVGGGIAVSGLVVLRAGRRRLPAAPPAAVEVRPTEPPPLPRSLSADPRRHSVRHGLRVRAARRRTRDSTRAMAVRRPGR
ncbi:MFS transporter [Cellulomonas sp. URHD0024]|uniref:MFS transporter n=1 Tax=Cellulomonas sp. URHD0024 TaxID=1302620 RepID=UPI0009DBE326|nr:MFS transporter [Cellulomonas sp. URHD0024]